MYKAYIRPQMTYASPAWAFISKKNSNRLKVVQNRTLRIIGGYDRYTRADKMHFDHEIPKHKSYIKCLALKMYAKAKFSRNWYVRKLEAVSMVIDRRVPRPLHILS
jgi:hypothetical protein